MAKLRKPSQHSIDLYNKLVQQQNEVRKKLRAMHIKAEETLGAGRLPALVMPKSARKIKKSQFQGLTPEQLRARLKAYWKKYKEMKLLFAKGINSYLKNTVFKGYKELWQGKDGINELPKGRFGRYTKEQIENSQLGSFMELYNQLFTRGVDFFMALLYTGKVLEFKVIYDELNGKGRGFTYVEQQADMLKVYNSPKARTELVEKARLLTGYYEHSESVKRKAKAQENKFSEEDLSRIKKRHENN